jgi:phosphomannomutase
VRPSGTEPKIKCYIEIRCAPSADLAAARARAATLRAAVESDATRLIG